MADLGNTVVNGKLAVTDKATVNGGTVVTDTTLKTINGTSLVGSGNITVATTDVDISGKADKATTLAGYGITDAKIENGKITLGNNSITPLTSHLTVDSALSSTSTNPVQNKVINSALAGKASSSHTHSTSIVASTDTSSIILAYGAKYKLTAGETSYVFTMPNLDESKIDHLPTLEGNIATAWDWGHLITNNGYSQLFSWNDDSNGSIAFAKANNQMSVQIDGRFYDNEGQYRLVDTNDLKGWTYYGYSNDSTLNLPNVSDNDHSFLCVCAYTNHSMKLTVGTNTTTISLPILVVIRYTTWGVYYSTVNAANNYPGAAAYGASSGTAVSICASGCRVNVYEMIN